MQFKSVKQVKSSDASLVRTCETKATIRSVYLNVFSHKNCFQNGFNLPIPFVGSAHSERPDFGLRVQGNIWQWVSYWWTVPTEVPTRFVRQLPSFINEYIFDFQKGHWSSEGAIFSFIQMTLKVIDDNKLNEFKYSYQQRSCCAAILISVPFLPSLLMVLSYVSNWTPLLLC